MAIASLNLTYRNSLSRAITATEDDADKKLIIDKIDELISAVGPTFGEMYQNNTGNNVVLTAGVWANVDSFTAGHLEGVAFSGNALVLPAGKYLLGATLSVAGVINNTYRFGFAKNGSVETDHLVSVETPSAKVTALSLHGIMAATEGQLLTFQALNVDNSGNLLPESITIVAERVGA